jgi:CubicO group peptidase (beta-lactamase class C family)
MTEIHGEARPGFEAVRDTFGQNFDEGNEVGAAFTLYHRGEKVVDLWGGVADEQTGAPWQEDTLQLVFSTTKGATAVCAHLLAQRGELDFDEPVATRGDFSAWTTSNATGARRSRAWSKFWRRTISRCSITGSRWRSGAPRSA